MKLLSNRLLVREEVPEKLNGIFLTKKVRMDLQLGRPRVFRVLGKGPGRLTRKGVLLPIECEVEDRVIVHSYTTGPMDLPDGTAIITSDEIIAVMPQI